MRLDLMIVSEIPLLLHVTILFIAIMSVWCISRPRKHCYLRTCVCVGISYLLLAGYLDVDNLVC